MKVCENAKISHRRLQKVELGSQTVIKIHLCKKKKKKKKRKKKKKNMFKHFNILRCQRSTQNVIKMLKTPKLILEFCEWSESIANRSKRSFGGIKR